jgi:DNA topoisomerase-1
MLTDDALRNTLKAHALTYARIDAPGIQRRRQGRGFRYLDHRGLPVTDPDTLAWIASLVIPPAWKQVWISPRRSAHILATGRDQKGRKQYIYHPEWNAMANERKYGDLLAFGRHLPALRQAVDRDLRRHALDRTRVTALAVALLDRTLIRIGNTEYERSNSTYGLTTLHDDHVEVRGSKVRFTFIGKSGKPHEIALSDRRLAKAVRACQELPGETLFQYVAEDGSVDAIDSGDVNAYLRAVTGQPFTAKVFRTWGGSVHMIRALCSLSGDEALRPEKCLREGVKSVAKALGNTTTVCRAYYIHPCVLEAFEQGALEKALRKARTAPDRFALQPEEQVLMSLMRRAQKR